MPPIPIDTRETLGVWPLTVEVLAASFDAGVVVPARALSSCLAVMPMYLLAREPTVIRESMPALAFVLLPRAVRAGVASSSAPDMLGRVR